ncbi:MAG: acyl-CoA synthetase, partial [Mycobacterium sp.]
MSTIASSVPAALAERARQRPDEPAYTFIDYEADPTGGFVESSTWSQVQQRAQVVAQELASCGSSGDRVAIIAPQGLE